MALESLIVSQADITNELVEKTLTGRVMLVQQDYRVHLTKESTSLPAPLKILLILCGKHAWQLLSQDKKPLLTDIDEISKEVSVFGSTIRVKLMELRKAHLIGSENGKYYILPHGIHAIEGMIKEATTNPKQKILKVKSSGKVAKKSNGIRSEIMEIFTKSPLNEDAVTQIMPHLKKARSSDAYLLAIYLAKEYMQIPNGLTPGEVNYLLTEPPINLPNKYYITNISRDLGKLREYVNPYKTGQAYEYRLNTNGIDHIKALIQTK